MFISHLYLEFCTILTLTEYLNNYRLQLQCEDMIAEIFWKEKKFKEYLIRQKGFTLRYGVTKCI